MFERDGQRGASHYRIQRAMVELADEQRLSADDLLKTKYMKSVMKTSTTILKDLLVRYEAWVQSGGVRASMADPLPWEEDEGRE